MAQTIRLTITPDLEKALLILHQSTLGTLNTTELIKMAVGGYAQLKNSGDTSLRDTQILRFAGFNGRGNLAGGR